MNKLCLLFIALTISVNLFAQDYQNIKNILKQDDLQAEQAKKKARKVQIEKMKIEKKRVRHFFPNQNDYLQLFAEYWLVKKAPWLKWDFQKPEYGLKEAFKGMLEFHGFYEVKFNLLLTNSPNISHFALPMGNKGVLLLVSLPFIREMDLTKSEIATLLLEDFIRSNMKYINSRIISEDHLKSFGKNYYKSKLPSELMAKSLASIDDFLDKKGFSFKQQFEVTNKMNNLLKSDLRQWRVYISLLQKIDKLVKNNLLYKNHLRLYPSPELQLKWILPKVSK